MAFRGTQTRLFEEVGKSFSTKSEPCHHKSALITEGANLADLVAKGILDPSKMGTKEQLALKTYITQCSSNPKSMQQFIRETRSTAGGLFNLGATCWMNSLLQAVFKDNETYLAQLRKQKAQGPAVVRNERLLVRCLKTHENNTKITEMGKALQKAKSTSDSVDLDETEIIADWLDTLSEENIQEKTVRDILEQKESEIERLERSNLLATTILEILELSVKEPSSEVNENLMIQLQILVQTLGEVRSDFKDTQSDPSDALSAILGPQGLNFLPDKGAPSIPVAYRKTLLRAVHTDANSSQSPIQTTQINLSHPEAKSVQEGIQLEFMNPIKLEKAEGYNFGKGPEDTYKVDYFVQNTKAVEEIIVQVPRFSSYWKKNTANIVFDEKIRIPFYNEDGTKVAQIITLKLESVIGHTGKNITSGHYVAYKRNKSGGYTLYNDSATPQNLTLKQAQEAFKKLGYLAVYKLEKVLDIEKEDEVVEFKTLNLPPPRTLPLPHKPTLLADTLELEEENLEEENFYSPLTSPSQFTNPSPDFATQEKAAVVSSSPSPTVSTKSFSSLSSELSDDWVLVEEKPKRAEETKDRAILKIEAAYRLAVGSYSRSTSNSSMPKSKKWVQMYSERKKGRFARK